MTAISMSINQILKSRYIICSVPEERKARAVKHSVESPVSNLFPASILQLHRNCAYYLDENSASLLSRYNGAAAKKYVAHVNGQDKRG